MSLRSVTIFSFILFSGFTCIKADLKADDYVFVTKGGKTYEVRLPDNSGVFTPQSSNREASLYLFSNLLGLNGSQPVDLEFIATSGNAPSGTGKYVLDAAFDFKFSGGMVYEGEGILEINYKDERMLKGVYSVPAKASNGSVETITGYFKVKYY